MTEQELFELLGNLDSRYIAEAQGFRSGRMQLQRVRKKKKRMQHRQRRRRRKLFLRKLRTNRLRQGTPVPLLTNWNDIM